MSTLLRVMLDRARQYILRPTFLTLLLVAELVYIGIRAIIAPSETGAVLVADIIAGLYMLLGILGSDYIGLIDYIIIMGILSTSYAYSISYPIYYYLILPATIISMLKFEPIIELHPVLVKVSVTLKRATKRIHLPSDIHETKLVLISTTTNFLTMILGIIAYAVSKIDAPLIASIYSALAIAFIFSGIASRRVKPPSKGKFSPTLLFVYRYPFLARINDKMKEKLSRLADEAAFTGLLSALTARYLALAVWSIQAAPAIILIFYPFVSGKPFAAALLFAVTILVPVILLQIPRLYLASLARARKTGVEKEYPLFLAYMAVMTSAGLTFTRAMRELTVGKARELFKAFRKEGEFFTRLVELRGFTEIRALEYLVETHPSEMYRNFVLGYLNQLRLAGNVAEYVEERLSEALQLYRRKLENYMNNLMLMFEVILTVLVIPTTIIMIAYIMNPGLIQPIMTAIMLIIAPGALTAFYAMAAAGAIELHDKYKFTFIPGAIGGAIGILVAWSWLRNTPTAATSFIIAMIALGHYIEYAKQRRVYNLIEQYLPIIWRDLSNLRRVLPISEAVIRLLTMRYPPAVKKIIARIASLRRHNVLISQQPWASGNYLWRLSQFLLGKIEDSGGGTTRLFYNIMSFFMDFNIIRRSMRSFALMYEGMTYFTPILLGFTLLVTVSILSSTSVIAAEMGQGQGAPVLQVGGAATILRTLTSGIPESVILMSHVIIIEVSFLLALAAAKVSSGTIRDTRPLAIAMLITTLILKYGPQIITLVAH